MLWKVEYYTNTKKVVWVSYYVECNSLSRRRMTFAIVLSFSPLWGKTGKCFYESFIVAEFGPSYSVCLWRRRRRRGRGRRYVPYCRWKEKHLLQSSQSAYVTDTAIRMFGMFSKNILDFPLVINCLCLMWLGIGPVVLQPVGHLFVIFLGKSPFSNIVDKN